MTHYPIGSDDFALHLPSDLLPEAPIRLHHGAAQHVQLVAHPSGGGQAFRLDIEVEGGRAIFRTGPDGDSVQFARVGAAVWDVAHSPWGRDLTDAVCEFGARLALFLSPRIEAIHAAAESAGRTAARGAQEAGRASDLASTTVWVAREALHARRDALGPVSAASLALTNAIVYACAGQRYGSAVRVAA